MCAFYINHNQFEKSLSTLGKQRKLYQAESLRKEIIARGRILTPTKRGKGIERCQDDAGKSRCRKALFSERRNGGGQRRKKISPSRRNRDRDVL